MKTPPHHGSVIRPRGQFLRSAQLERDFADPEALAGYILTDGTVSHMERVRSGLRKESRDRAFRIVGEYGVGKSTFALLLAHWLSEGAARLPSHCQNVLREQGLAEVAVPRLTPLLVTGKRQTMASAIQQAVRQALSSNLGSLPPKERKLVQANEVDDVDALCLLNSYRDLATRQGKGGVLLVIDEAGKLLEHAAQHPEENDVFLWQLLAEQAAGSGDQPLVVVSILHQGFSAYAHGLGLAQEREWEKVAGRYTELDLRYPLEQSARIIAAALNVDCESLPPAMKETMQTQMREALGKNWYGPVSDPSAMVQLAPSLYPVGPLTLPVLLRFLRRYGQNERSVFSFLFGGEPGGVLSHVQRTCEPFALDDLYGYANTNFDHVLTRQGEASRWLAIKAMVAAASGTDTLTDRVLRVIGILNLVNSDDLLSTEETVCSALQPWAAAEKVSACIATLKSLEGKRVLYDRGAAGGLYLWSHVSVDLQSAFDAAVGRVPAVSDCVGFVRHYLADHRLVARAHYIRTGNLRFFEVRYCSLKEFEKVAESPPRADANGTLLVPLCETKGEIDKARAIAVTLNSSPHCICTIPRHPVTSVAPAVRELLVWEHVTKNTPELNGDPYARETVALRTEEARTALVEALDRMVALDGAEGNEGATVCWKGKEQNDLKSGKPFRAFLSKVLDEVYHDAPLVRHELLNRDSLSSAGAAARMRLIEGVLENSGVDLFGMDPAKRPPEMSMYLSTFRKGNVHVQSKDGTWHVELPPDTADGDPLRLGPTLRRVRNLLEQTPDARVSVSAVLRDLRRDPYGVKDGLAGLLLAVFAVVEQREVAFFEDGRYIPRLSGADFMRLTKKPTTFEIQLCRIAGVRSEIYSRLAGLLAVTVKDGEGDLLDVVRPLCVFAAGLPPHVHKTHRLSREAIQVRDALLNAREPVKLLFSDLPRACGLPPVPTDSASADGATEFVTRLQDAITEIRTCYYELRHRILNAIRESLSPDGDDSWRTTLARRAEPLFTSVTDPRLRAFCFRLTDETLGQEEWGESVAALLASKPPREWTDHDETYFAHELAQLAERFRRTESALFGRAGSASPSAGLRVCLTRGNGDERMKVVAALDCSQEELSAIEKEFRTIIEREGARGLAALAKVLWERLDG